MCVRHKVFLPAVVFLSLVSSNAYSASITLALEPVAPPDGQVTAQITPPEANYTVQPSIGGQVNTVDVDIYCSFFGAPVPDCDITINPLVPAEPNTGGHIHSDGGRPLGTLNPMQGNSGSDAFLTVTYTAPIASGVIRVSGSGYHPNYGFFSGTFTIGIMVPGLQELGASGNYDLVGQTAAHPSNHFGTATFLASLGSAAQAYTTAYPGQRLAYNDISLPYGGLFDISGGWSTPHISHRLGTDADLRLVPAQQRQKLQQLIYKSGISLILVEGNHWHLRQ